MKDCFCSDIRRPIPMFEPATHPIWIFCLGILLVLVLAVSVVASAWSGLLRILPDGGWLLLSFTLSPVPNPDELGPLTALNAPFIASLLAMQSLQRNPPAFIHGGFRDFAAVQSYLDNAITVPCLCKQLKHLMILKTPLRRPGGPRP